MRVKQYTLLLLVSILSLVLSLQPLQVFAYIDKGFLQKNTINMYTGNSNNSCAQPTATGECGEAFNIASFNILHTGGDSFESKWRERLPKSLKTLKDNQVQVAGLQEVRPEQHNLLAEIEGKASGDIVYDRWPTKTRHPGFSPNIVIWNKNKFTFVSGEQRNLKYDNGEDTDHLIIVKLKDSSGNMFYIASIHDPANIRPGSTALNKQSRIDNANNYKKIFSELSSEKTPLFLTGDFNSDSDGYCILSGGESIQNVYDAVNNVNGKCKSKNKVGIDHIYMPKGQAVTATEYKAIQSEKSGKSKNGSDHPTIIATISLTGNCKSSQGDNSSLVGTGGTGTNKDYRNRPILTDAQLSAIKDNQEFYEKAASEVGIPWQLLAVIHLRETGLKRRNPSNGDGPYQILSTNYRESDRVSDEMFLKQSIEAARFIKGKSETPDKLSSGDEAAVKDVFFRYNGRASAYANQATRNGFDKPYEGSPYVMNIADEKRDPERNRTTWGQIKRDGGGIEYPANSDYGAFVVYSSIAGIASDGTCTSEEDVAVSGTVTEKIIALAEKELKLWNSGRMKPGTDFHKYSQGRTENWCADFASWIYNKARYPLTSSPGGNESSVDGIREIGERGDKFVWHDARGYTPKPGDIQVQKGSGVSHVSIVVAVNGNKIEKIGGNQSGNGGPTTSKVTKDNWMQSTVGYVSPKN